MLFATITDAFIYRAGEPCKKLNELPEGYVTYCKQKYIYRKLISLEENGIPSVDTFRIPSACSCAYKRNIEFIQRFGKAITPKP